MAGGNFFSREALALAARGCCDQRSANLPISSLGSATVAMIRSPSRRRRRNNLPDSFAVIPVGRQNQVLLLRVPGQPPHLPAKTNWLADRFPRGDRPEMDLHAKTAGGQQPAVGA